MRLVAALPATTERVLHASGVVELRVRDSAGVAGALAVVVVVVVVVGCCCCCLCRCARGGPEWGSVVAEAGLRAVLITRVEAVAGAAAVAAGGGDAGDASTVLGVVAAAAVAFAAAAAVVVVAVVRPAVPPAHEPCFVEEGHRF